MALDKAALSALMVAKIQAIPGVNITQVAELQAFCDALADAVVTHITGAAVVNPGTFAAGVDAVTGQGTVS